MLAPFRRQLNYSSRLLARPPLSLQPLLPPPSHFLQPPPAHFSGAALEPTPPTSGGSVGSLRELAVLLTMLTLSFFAVDNYINRIKLEKMINEATIINFKTLKVQQANFNTAQKRKNLQIISERRENAKTFARMGLHIALLREQLIELGHSPVDIDTVLQEYEKTVKVNTSLANVNDQVVYLVDNSRLKEHFPSIHDYEKKALKPLEID